jgi:hypothetical protein
MVTYIAIGSPTEALDFINLSFTNISAAYLKLKTKIIDIFL